MIWSLDLYENNGENFSIIPWLCRTMNFELSKPCIYLVEDDKIIVKGTEADISIDFVTQEINHCSSHQTLLQDIEEVKHRYWGNYKNEKIADGFISDYSMLTDAIRHFAVYLIKSEENEGLQGFANNTYSYENKKGNGYHFYTNAFPNKPKPITFEDLMIRWLKFSSKIISFDSMIRNASVHDGIQLYHFLVDYGILKRL